MERTTQGNRCGIPTSEMVMPWKNELDRLVNHCVLEADKTGEEGVQRALGAVRDLLGLSPGRAESQFHVGTAQETLGEAAGSLPPAASPEEERWRTLGRLDAASRRSSHDRVRDLMSLPGFDESLARPEGRVALRAVGRMLLRDGEEGRAFDYYRRHLQNVDDEGSRRDAEFLLEEALRRSDREDVSPEETLARLDRAAEFAKSAGLDARAGAKVDRKLGRVHQLAGRWKEAVDCYRRALEHLPQDDPYRSVLIGDTALASLGVRGTLDLLPTPNRPGSAEAEQILKTEEGKGEGRSYNAIYTQGMLAYERNDWATAAQCFREADTLMRENRAKARIVHARSRFFLAHCLLAMGATGQDLEDAQRWIQREASGVALEPETKAPVLDALAAVAPEARIPGRGGQRREREGGREREGRGREPRERREFRDDRGPREAQGTREPHEHVESRDAREQPRETREQHREQPREPREPRESREPRGPAPSRAPVGAEGFLEEARGVLAEDPHRALELVDRAFKSRPDFETWFGAYRTRLDALVRLEETEEALRTYERFRAKLYQRSALERLEKLLLEPGSPLTKIFDEANFHEELVELYEVMPGRTDRFVEECITVARMHLETGQPERIGRAFGLLKEAAARDPVRTRAPLEEAQRAAAAVGVNCEDASPDECRERLAHRDGRVRILLVGGDEGRRPHLEQFQDLAKRIGFDGDWIFTGARPPYKTLREIEDQARNVNAILLHHAAGPELRQEVKRMGEDLKIPVRQASWLGTVGVQNEVLRAVREAAS